MIDQRQFEEAQKAELDNWEKHANDAERIRHELREHSEIAGPLKHLVGDRRFEQGLEVGIGAFGLGFLAVHLADQVEQLDGVDPLPQLELQLNESALQEQVDRIRSRVNYVQCAAESLPFEDGSYDIVSSINVVDHARDPRAIVKEIGRVLRPGGILAFAVSTLSLLGLLKWRIQRRLKPNEWLFIAHPHIFSWPTANRMLESMPGRTLWYIRPSLLQHLGGHGRMSFWIREKSG